MFKNALIYRIEQWDVPSLTQIEERLAAAPFTECGASQPESAGWVPPRGQKHGALAEAVAAQLVLQMAIETKAVPGSVVKSQVQAQLDRIEQETGRRPKGKLLKELKEGIVHALLPRAFPKRSHTPVWVDPQGGWVWVGTTTAKRADAIVTRLMEGLGGQIRLAPVQTQRSPAMAMAQWLVDQEPPPGFTIDRDCELKLPGQEKSAVRYARHTLDIAEVAEHVRQGKLPTRLALTWAGRVSFVLSETLALKKIELLDGVLEGAGVDAAAQRQADEGFDADVAIATGELRQLWPALLEALGGLQEAQPASAGMPPVSSTSPASSEAPF